MRAKKEVMERKLKVIPTVFSKNKKEFDERFEKLKKISREIQIDFMDGKFVKGKSTKIEDIPNMFGLGIIVEAHLMVKNPKDWIDDLRKKFFGRIIFHYEAVKNNQEALRIIRSIRKHGMHAILAIDSKTDIKKIEKLIPALHHILIMGVKAGKEKQKLLKTTFNKIKYMKEHHPQIKIQIDGGVNKQTAKQLKKAGADILNTGSYVSDAKNPKKALEELEKI